MYQANESNQANPFHQQRDNEKDQNQKKIKTEASQNVI